MYVMDVIEEKGVDIAHKCYWDFGKWSDLRSKWIGVPECITFLVNHKSHLIYFLKYNKIGCVK